LVHETQNTLITLKSVLITQTLVNDRDVYLYISVDWSTIYNESVVLC
jgi:hypothetical protein